MADSDSSLDSELLAVAGARKKGTGKKRGRKALSSDEEEEDVSSEEVSLDDESDMEEMRATSKKRGSAQKPPAKKRQARGRGRVASEEEDDSSDEQRFEIDEEDLIEDEDDRKRLAAMTELQREFELATRAEKRNAEMLRQKLLNKSDARAEKAGAKEAKRVSGRSKSGREEREEAAKKSAMEELKAARERKARGAEERARKRGDSEEPEDEDEDEEAAEERRERREAERARRDEPSEEGMLESEDELSDEERGGRSLYGRDRMGEEGEDEEDEAPPEDVKRIQVRRERLEQWVNEPFFEETLPGCMVRVAVGEEQGPDGMPMRKYMLCQVVAVETRQPGYYKDSGKPWKSPYLFGGDKTHKWILVERGISQRGMPLALVSNSGFTVPEFESWQRTLKEQGRPQVSRRQAKEVHERLVKAHTYTYTAADVDRLLKEKKAKGAAPRNIALEKARLDPLLQHAREAGDADTATELEAQIAALDAALEEAKSRRKVHGMASLNKRNADANFKNALDNVSNRVAGAGGAQDAKTSQLDPFSRRATRPMIYWSTKKHTDEDGAAAAQAAAAAAEAEQQAAEEQQQQQQRKGKLDMDSIVDLSSLDLSILDRHSRMPPLARKLLGPTWRPDPLPPGARLISLEEYRRSRGW